jgi:hypothetical protein
MAIDMPDRRDGEILEPSRMPDIRAIEDLGISYAHAVDDRDWGRWEALFLSDGLVDYTRAGGIKGTPAEVAEWMVGAMANFAFTLHTTSTHEIRLTGPATATGRSHVFNRNGVEWEGRRELFDVGAWYEDTYSRIGGGWRIASRIEHTTYMAGGSFADMILRMINDPESGLPPVFG